ncbi:hypothetical protein FNV43_RR22941 [Rhamnella rubrinervis]|uniref:Uncharacterized protein n=1 Tax=Rhamnella rubrinervis TaxID=2594499 RepID=A0A8K0GRL0_9ROSA|nr:hypothetical protein FNV43_RR22941 [Rhamnella rubrinervis]
MWRFSPLPHSLLPFVNMLAYAIATFLRSPMAQEMEVTASMQHMLSKPKRLVAVKPIKEAVTYLQADFAAGNLCKASHL